MKHLRCVAGFLFLFMLSLPIRFAYAQTPTPGSSFGSIDCKGKGILLGENIVAFDNSGRAITGLKLSSGQVVDIVGKTKKDYRQDNSKFHWAKYPFVELRYGGSKLWVSGRFVFRFNDLKPTLSVKIGTNRLDVFLGWNLIVGATNGDGLTVWDMFQPVILRSSSDSGHYYLVPAPTKDTLYDTLDKTYYIVSGNDTLLVPWKDYYALMDNGEAGEKIVSAETKNDRIILHVSAEYMEGHATYEVVIPFDRKPGNAKVIHYIRKEE